MCDEDVPRIVWGIPSPYHDHVQATTSKPYCAALRNRLLYMYGPCKFPSPPSCAYGAGTDRGPEGSGMADAREPRSGARAARSRARRSRESGNQIRLPAGRLGFDRVLIS